MPGLPLWPECLRSAVSPGDEGRYGCGLRGVLRAAPAGRWDRSCRLHRRGRAALKPACAAGGASLRPLGIPRARRPLTPARCSGAALWRDLPGSSRQRCGRRCCDSRPTPSALATRLANETAKASPSLLPPSRSPRGPSRAVLTARQLARPAGAQCHGEGRLHPRCHAMAARGSDKSGARPVFLIPLTRRGRGRAAGAGEGGPSGAGDGPPHPALSPRGERETRRCGRRQLCREREEKWAQRWVRHGAGGQIASRRPLASLRVTRRRDRGGDSGGRGGRGS